MNLKQSLVIALLPIFAACSTDEGGDNVRRNGAISFVVRENVTRAIEPIDSTYQLYVSALWHTDKTIHYGNTTVQKLTNPTATASFWDSGWTWPPTGSLDFIAWGGTKAIDGGCASFTYTGGATDLTSATTTTTFKTVTLDFTSADKQLKGDNDILYLNTLDEASCSGSHAPRSLVFNHAMACVAVGIAAGDSTTADVFKLRSTKIDELVTSGKLYIKVDENRTEEKLRINALWDKDESRRIKTTDITLAALSHKEGETTKPLVMPDSLGHPVFLTQPVFVLPSPGDEATLTIGYSINDSNLSFSIPFTKFWEGKTVEHQWEQGTRYTYNLTVKLNKIEIDRDSVYEEQWQTEIGGTAYEPEWNIEISTGALEATWGVEIGGQAYEIHWEVEIGATALESVWVTETQTTASESGWNSEIGSGANENHWNSETGANAGESNWNSETGVGACEESWTRETGGGAYEAQWDDDGEDIIIGSN